MRDQSDELDGGFDTDAGAMQPIDGRVDIATVRPMRPAMWRGWRRRCPSCGSGPMMQGYLKVRHSCPVCNEEFHHHRADDGPPYLTLLIVGHIIGPAMLWFFIAYEPDPYTFMAIFMVASVALSLWFLPRLKGMLVGIQWAARMNGFGRT